MPMGAAFEIVRAKAHAAHERGNKLMFIGNGGSAGITSHLATDFSKNGGLRATAFNDGAVLTCLGNDFGYEHVFAKQIEWHGRPGDLLLAISSSGRSANILNGARAARECGCEVVTMSGFGDDNPLRMAGDVNFYVRSSFYGFVEVAHLALLHAILDLDMGWAPESGDLKL
jgi:D-sedoheptulose 7-phosphate isomerase